MLFHLGSFITFRPSTTVVYSQYISRKGKESKHQGSVIAARKKVTQLPNRSARDKFTC